MNFSKHIIFVLLIGVVVFATSAKNDATLSLNNIDKIIASMTIEQKAGLLVGTDTMIGARHHKVIGSAGFTVAYDSLGIPSVNLADGPVGVRINPEPFKAIGLNSAIDSLGLPVLVNTNDLIKNRNIDSSKKYYTSFCTAFPSTIALASTWNRDMAALMGKTIGEEARAYGVDVILTPGINIMRNPLCGRNFEYYSEDPLLTGLLSADMINGLQSCGVGASLKHFVANNQQTGKLYNDARIPVRALREIYLKPFEISIKHSNPWTIMGSYNKIGGRYTQENSELLQTILRSEWGYEGLIITDWYKNRNTKEQILAGINLIMPGQQSQINDIIDGVKSGEISEKLINERVKRVLIFLTKTLTYNNWEFEKVPDLKKNSMLSRQVATESMVLLKNEDTTLPLAKSKKIALFGASAYWSVANGTGSSTVNKPHVIDISKGFDNANYALNPRLKDIYEKYKDCQVTLLDKYPNAAYWEKLSYFRPAIPEMDISKATELVAQEAKNSDIAVIVIGRRSGEESDRKLENDFYLSKDERFLIDKVCGEFHAVNKKVVVVLNTCGVMEMASWNNKPDAILVAWFPGQECGDAVVDILSGRVNPSGKLPVTFPIDYWDIPSAKNYPEAGVTKSGKNFDYTNYEEGILVGYRYFTSARREVSYPFGFGLSYTQFEYSTPKIEKKKDKYIAEITVKNIGKVSGKDVTQLYISAPQTLLLKPAMELKAFAKTKELKPGESQKLTMTFTEYEIASFDEAESRWITEKGEFKALFCTSADDVKFALPFRQSKEKTWKVNDVLHPVVPITAIEIPINK
ncbi:MAG: glycoside hydrolase family 3 C-terminal domain-containing protein [Muribaculaceae bacterium]|nr:glycoside hydrolase family 3 C-terminal domain-containing protein [Muribaculaceae bacterium]